MKLPFAVYTARHGYAWQSGTDHGIEKLDRFRRAVGKMPEFDFGERASCGLLDVGDEVVAYRFMRHEKADFKGRDAGYLALTFCSRADARFIDADAMLSEYPFATPLVDPPSFFEYAGKPAVPAAFTIPAQASTGCFDPAGCLSSAGFLFAQPFVGTLRIFRSEPDDGKGAQFRYDPPARSVVVEKEPKRMPVTVPTPMPREEPPEQKQDVWKWVAIIALCVAIFEAVALTWVLLEPSVPVEQEEALNELAADELTQQGQKADAENHDSQSEPPADAVVEVDKTEKTKKP